MRKILTIVASLSLLATFMPVASAQTLIVGNKREHTISFIDLRSGEEVIRTETGRFPHEVAVSPNGKTAVVVSYRGGLYNGNTLHVFDAESGEKTGVIKLGEHKAPHGLKWIPGTSRVIATTEASESVVIVDIKTKEVVGSVQTDQQGSHMVALSKKGDRAFVANINAGSFTVIDLKKFTKIKDVKAGEGTEAISVTPDGKHIWVGNNGSKSMMVFDAHSYEKLKQIKTEGIPIRVEVSPDGKSVAVSEPDLSRVRIYDAKSMNPIKSIDLSAQDAKVPVTLLFSQDGARLWAAATGSARVVEIDTSDWSITRSLGAGEGSDGLGFSPLQITAENSK